MGKVFKFDNDVDTDQIIASQYLLFPSVGEMAPHTFESLDADFAKNVKPGDFVVAAENFGWAPPANRRRAYSRHWACAPCWPNPSRGFFTATASISACPPSSVKIFTIMFRAGMRSNCP